MAAGMAGRTCAGGDATSITVLTVNQLKFVSTVYPLCGSVNFPPCVRRDEWALTVYWGFVDTSTVFSCFGLAHTAVSTTKIVLPAAPTTFVNTQWSNMYFKFDPMQQPVSWLNMELFRIIYYVSIAYDATGLLVVFLLKRWIGWKHSRVERVLDAGHMI
jgi:hypothetical protein